MPLLTVPAALIAAVALLMYSAVASAAYAPPDRPGPPLSVPAAKLAAALSCSGRLAGAAHEPVLLVPGTDAEPRYRLRLRLGAGARRSWRGRTAP